MERFAEEDALDLLIQVRKPGVGGIHLRDKDIERICRRLLGDPTDEALTQALNERLRSPRWSDVAERAKRGDFLNAPGLQ